MKAILPELTAKPVIPLPPKHCLLPLGERVEAGDMRFVHGAWVKCDTGGTFINKWSVPYCRLSTLPQRVG